MRAFVTALLVLALLAGCRARRRASRRSRASRSSRAKVTDFAPSVTLTGVIAAQVQTELSFRVGGKIAERLVNVGDHVTADQVLARLDPDEQQAELQAGQGRRAVGRGDPAADDQRLRAPEEPAGDRQHHAPRLRPGRRGRCARPQAQLDQAQSQLAQANDQLAYTELQAPTPTASSSRSMAEAGQVVAQAQPVFMLARDGQRDAVFNVHEWALANVDLDKGIQVTLVSDPVRQDPGRPCARSRPRSIPTA